MHKKLYSQLCRIAKHSYTHSLFQNTKKDSRKTWDLLNETTNRAKKTGSLSYIFDIDGKLTTDKSVIANAFNQHYATVGTKMSSKFTGQPEHEKYLVQEKTRMRLTEVSVDDVSKIIKSMQNKKSHGHDLLTNQILKRCSFVLSVPLTHIINASIRQNVFPHVWKKSRVIPLHKKDSKLEITNYRPISLCPVGSKVLEKVVNKQILHYLTVNNILPQNQFGFRPKNRTSHLLLKAINTIEQSQLNKKNALSRT